MNWVVQPYREHWPTRQREDPSVVCVFTAGQYVLARHTDGRGSPGSWQLHLAPRRGPQRAVDAMTDMRKEDQRAVPPVAWANLACKVHAVRTKRPELLRQ